MSNKVFHAALLGSALAFALTPAMAASVSRAELERNLAITGLHPARASSSPTFGYRLVPGSTYTVLHSFAGGSSDGSDPTAQVTLDSSGNIWGVTDGGGANGSGTLFEITPSGTESIVHSFGGTNDGQIPDGAVMFDSSGNMYGTTDDGGSAGGDGTLWELTAGGTYSVLHNFDYTDGDFIRGRLIQDKNGNIYGTALFGGANGDGDVFEYTPSSGTFTILHSFDGTDGQYPEHGVVMDKNGNLYGGTAFGGANDHGAIYEISASGTFTTLYSFTGASDGGFLYGGVAVDKKGDVYGNAASYGANGQGTVFKFSKGTLTVLYNFCSQTNCTDGSDPEGDMLLVGKKLYSTASTGGANNDGVIFELTTKGKETVLQSMSATDGDGYSDGVIRKGKTLYGTISGGGANSYGVVFSLTK